MQSPFVFPAYAAALMTAGQLWALGAPEFVYLKRCPCDGAPGFMIYAADGTALAMVASILGTITRAAVNGVRLVMVQ